MTLNDRPLIGSLAGIAAVVVRDIYCLIPEGLGISTYLCFRIAADFFSTTKYLHTAAYDILGLLADAAMGAVLGAVYYFIQKRLGGRNHLLKGIGYGLGVWLFLFGILMHSLPHTAGYAPKDPLSNISAFFGHVLFGLVLAAVYRFLERRYVEPQG